MDPIAVLQSRIEQLEAKLGVNPDNNMDGQQGDSVTTNLLNTVQAMNNATAEYEKLTEARNMANELNNYTDPNLAENMQQHNMRMHEVIAAEPIIKHHCHCMQRCKQAAPVLDSEAIQQVPAMQETVKKMQLQVAEVKADAEAVSQGIQELAETCGTAASKTSEELAAVAQKVDEVEQKMFPRRRNGLD